MPNWAELHEISNTEKATHDEVNYKHGSKQEHCGNCVNFIPENPAVRSRCRTVQCPIARSMWCKRYKPC